jgi:hypothetical protein
MVADCGCSITAPLGMEKGGARPHQIRPRQAGASKPTAGSGTIVEMSASGKAL